MLAFGPGSSKRWDRRTNPRVTGWSALCGVGRAGDGAGLPGLPISECRSRFSFPTTRDTALRWPISRPYRDRLLQLTQAAGAVQPHGWPTISSSWRMAR